MDGEILVGPNPCSECSGEYGEHEPGCSRTISEIGCLTVDALIDSIADEFVGVWKFKTITEGPENRRWCASVNVAGRLVDTEDFRTVRGAISRAVELVKQLQDV